mmetsp:Transcript_37592/g.49541  ORF Transcript_37592/g.49541 Transcript_37592/m.49541 type:complete len:350 (+) Transcript_37592:240-1289(+)
MQITGENQISSAISRYGVAPGARWMMEAEMEAAQLAIESGVYAVWRSLKNGQDCTRIGNRHRCFCGHSYGDHKFATKKSRHQACLACGCKRFEVVPTRPEEIGAWWLPRRKNFDVRSWRPKCKCSHSHEDHDPNIRSCKLCVCNLFNSDYCCLNCDGLQEEHEVVFESEEERVQTGRPVLEAFFPLSETPHIQHQVFSEEGKKDGPYVRPRRNTGSRGHGRGGRGPRPRSAHHEQQISSVPAASSLAQSLESLVLSGAISAAEYHARLQQDLEKGGGSQSSIQQTPIDTSQNAIVPRGNSRNLSVSRRGRRATSSGSQRPTSMRYKPLSSQNTPPNTTSVRYKPLSGGS